MDTKKSFTSLIITIVLSAICMFAYGAFNFVFIFLRDLVLAFNQDGNADVSNITLIIVIVAILTIITLVVLIMACCMFKYVKRNGEKLETGKTKLISYAILLFVLAVLNIVLSVVVIDSILISFALLIVAIIHTICGLLVLIDLKQLKNLSIVYDNKIEDKID